MTIKVLVLLIENEKILLLKEWSNKKDGYFWNLIKGTFENRLDKSLTDSAIREAKEEAGIDIRLKKIMDITIVHNTESKIYLTYLGEVASGVPSVPNKLDQNIRKENIQKLKWVSEGDFEKLPESELMSPLIRKVYNKWKQKKYSSLTLVTEINNLA